jgi:hypothetical protein
MDSVFGFLAGIGVMVFLMYAGSGLHNYLSNKHKSKTNG